MVLDWLLLLLGQGLKVMIPIDGDYVDHVDHVVGEDDGGIHWLNGKYYDVDCVG